MLGLSDGEAAGETTGVDEGPGGDPAGGEDLPLGSGEQAAMSATRRRRADERRNLCLPSCRRHERPWDVLVKRCVAERRRSVAVSQRRRMSRAA
jgi:hypothetical protein